MYSLGIFFVVTGFATFIGVVIYYLIDERRTGVVFRKNKKILFPILLVAWIIFGIGAILAQSATG